MMQLGSAAKDLCVDASTDFHTVIGTVDMKVPTGFTWENGILPPQHISAPHPKTKSSKYEASRPESCQKVGFFRVSLERGRT